MKRLTWLLLLAAAGAPAQEIDTVVFEKDRKNFRLLDQISDPAERGALEAIFAVRDPAGRLARTGEFLQQYPASAFLSVVYDVAAKSCIDLRRPGCVLENAARSLRLLPENPVLLVSLSEVQAGVGLLERAALSARRALELLERYARPSGFTEPQWKALEPKLRAAARAVLEAQGLPIPGAAPLPPARPAEYAGSAACQPCHAQEHRNWQRTGMARMLTPYRRENVFGDFGGNSFPGREGGAALRMVDDHGRHYFEMRDRHGEWRRYPVDYTIGSKWQQAYGTRLENGRIHVFPIQYNRLTGKWFNYWATIDPPGSPRTVIEHFTTFSDATAYQINCAPCHTSQLKQVGKEATAENIAFAEPGVNCEMCHGPSAAHVRQWRQKATPAKAPAEPPVEFRKIGGREYVAICAQCHRQSAMFERGPHGEMNYSGVTPAFTSKAKGRPLIEFSRKAFYRDGRFRETTFIVESFERSQCFDRGGAHCGHCHHPHPADFPANLKALKYQDDPDRMCTQCHAEIGRNARAHTRHQPESEGARCVACHMPRIMRTVEFQARTHTIDDIPDADMTARFGPEESPNACLDCHRERGLAWVAARLRERREPRADSAPGPEPVR